MIRYGFIHTKEDIKFLVLFAMDLLPFPVTFETVVDLITWCDDGFGYFELSEAFYEMIPTGHIDESIENGAKLYAITDKGREATRIFEKQLPYPVREAAQRSALRVVRRDPYFGHRARRARSHRPHGNGAGVRHRNGGRQPRTGDHARAHLQSQRRSDLPEAARRYDAGISRLKERSIPVKHLKQLALLLACCVGGNLISALLHGALPGNVLGLTLLLVLLICRAVKLHHVEDTADFLLQNMAFFFLPACLGILDIFADIKGEILAILAVCLLTTLCTAAATALTVHIVLKLQHRENEEAFDRD